MPVCNCSVCGRFMRCSNWAPGPGLEGSDIHTNPPGCSGYCVCDRHRKPVAGSARQDTAPSSRHDAEKSTQ